MEFPNGNSNEILNGNSNRKIRMKLEIQKECKSTVLAINLPLTVPERECDLEYYFMQELREKARRSSLVLRFWEAKGYKFHNWDCSRRRYQNYVKHLSWREANMEDLTSGLEPMPHPHGDIVRQRDWGAPLGRGLD